MNIERKVRGAQLSNRRKAGAAVFDSIATQKSKAGPSANDFPKPLLRLPFLRYTSRRVEDALQALPQPSATISSKENVCAKQCFLIGPARNPHRSIYNLHPAKSSLGGT
jgi:hypothetical protein